MERPHHVHVFIEAYLPCARSVELFLRIPISVILAYAAAESDWGRSSLARKGIIFGQPIIKKTCAREAFMNFGESLRQNSLFDDARRYMDDPERFIDVLTTGFHALTEKGKSQMARILLKEYDLKDFDAWIYSDLSVNELQEI